MATLSSFLRFTQTRNLQRILFCAFFVLSIASLAHGQSKIEVTDPVLSPGAKWPSPLDLSFTTTADIKKVRILITAPGNNSKDQFDADATKREQSRSINLLEGLNQIQILGFKEGDKDSSASATLTVTCSGKKCGAGGGDGGQGGPGSGGGSVQTSDNVIIDQPIADQDTDTFKPAIEVQKASGIKKLAIDVLDEKGKSVDHKDPIDIRYFEKSALGYLSETSVKLAKGRNRILVYDPDKPEKLTAIVVNCPGAKCGTAPPSPPTESVVSIKEPGKGAVAHAGSVTSTIEVKKGGPGKLQFEVWNGGKLVPQRQEDPIDVPDPGAKPSSSINPDIRIRKGTNQIRVFDPSAPGDSTKQAAAEVSCDGPDCIGDDTGAIRIKPEADSKFQDTSFVKSTITVKKPIKKIGVTVLNQNKPVAQLFDTYDVEHGEAESKDVDVKIRIGEGDNKVIVFDANPADKDKVVRISTEWICKGPDCGSEGAVSTIPTNSRYVRAVIGIEQAGASSAESKTNPFLDFFFNTPFRFSKNGNAEPLPRLSTWGQVRFSATPDQTAGFAVFPSNFVNQVTDPTKVVDLVQSFDFLAGVEFRLSNSNGTSMTLIPGIKQKTSLYFTAGGGAISPLTVKRQSAQLFAVPPDAVPPTATAAAVPADPRRAEFIRRFGDPGTLKYVGFVPLERDRFFRQYYFGLRLKTNYCEDSSCNRYLNRFPGLVDFAIGQNEAVTGGRLKTNVRDSANNLIGRRRPWVLRVDAFFPLPFKETNFLYLYGTAMMGISSSPKIQTPLFLDVPASTIQITDPNVYVPPPDLQPTRIDRDYYKIGIGVNLSDLFNRPKPKPQ